MNANEAKLGGVPDPTVSPYIVWEDPSERPMKAFRRHQARSFLMEARQARICESSGQLWELVQRPGLLQMYDMFFNEWVAIYRQPLPPVESLSDEELLTYVWKMLYYILPCRNPWWPNHPLNKDGVQVTLSEGEGRGKAKEGRITQKSTQRGYSVFTTSEILDKLGKQPNQAQIIGKALLAYEGGIDDAALDKIMNRLVSVGALKTKQDPMRVFKFYQRNFIEIGLLSINT